MKRRQNSISSRSLISGSCAGMFSAALLKVPDLKHSGIPRQQNVKPITRTLGRTVITIPVVNMGVMNTTDPQLLIASYEHGIKLFDTALRYNNEDIVGDVIMKLPRDKVYLETKVPVPDYQNPGSMSDKDMHKKLLEDFDGCMKRLKTDYVDALFLHNIRFMRDAKNAALKDALAKIHKSGRVRHIGISNHTLMADQHEYRPDGQYFRFRII